MFQRTTTNKTMTDAQKGRMVSMYLDGNHSMADIAEQVGCSKPTVCKWIKKYVADGNVCRIKPPGRSKSTTPAQDLAILQAVIDKPFSNVTHIAHENQIGYKTALRRIHDSGLQRRRAARRTFLTNQIREQRMEFCRFMLSPEQRNNWNKILFTDEKSFCSENDNVKFVYRPKNERFNEKYIAHSSRSGRVTCSYWGWMASTGLGELHPITEKNNSANYIDILNDFVVAVPVLAGPVNELIFQQDNSSIHTSRISNEFVHSLGFENVLNWPSHSPDLNLIEHIWAMMERMRENEKPRTKAELNKMVQRIWEVLRCDSGLVQRLYESLERRFEFVLNHNGSWCV